MECKKIIIYIACGLVLCGACFWAGSAGPGKRADGMADRIGEIQGKLNESIGLVESLRTENSELVRINSQLESTNIQFRRDIKELQEINDRFNRIITDISNSNSDTRQGITEAEAGIGSVADRIRKVLEENKKAESDNNN